MQKFVPVVSIEGQPLMPTTNKRADSLVRRGKAIRRFNRGIFYIQLTGKSKGYTQPIAVGIDPGSKKEAFTVKSEQHTYLNIQADAVTWVEKAEEVSTQMRRTRRSRKTPYRKMRPNRNQGQFRLPPSTRARSQWKLRIARWLAKLYPITCFVVEDIKATTRKGKGGKWNQSFSPLQVGKDWFYWQLSYIAPVDTLQGYETKVQRDKLGLKKNSAKMSDKFEAHCVDSWVLANWYVGGHTEPDNKAMLFVTPLRFHHRQLHRLQPEPGGIRKPYGGTMSMGFKRGSWVKHPRYGVCYVGGTSKERISLHNLETGKRLTQNARPDDCQFLTLSSFRVRKEQEPHSSPA
ncbi:MAG: RRXRR domain-containing protein [Chloroflexi bacterium]|nr:RRXRR domain-containing protein [Chloroflexota bacterium]